jgi:ATP-dependent protease HslVU (ClpYQ) peptidase subunit
MTVCIGAMSAWYPNSNAIVVASDRMITMGSFMQYEHDVPKIRFVIPKTCVMLAGDTEAAITIIDRLSSHFQHMDPEKKADTKVLEVVQTAQGFYEELRQEKISASIFRPRGITMREFYQGGLQSSLQPRLVATIDDEVMGYDLGVELLIAGIGADGAHIYTVGNPGTVDNYRHTGYVAIGSGGIHAVQSMIGFGHSSFHGLFETIFTVYASKKRAEAAPGVGGNTDLCIISPDGEGFFLLSSEQLEKLETLYKEFSQPSGIEIDRRVADLNLFPEAENESQTHTASTENKGDSVEPV